MMLETRKNLSALPSAFLYDEQWEETKFGCKKLVSQFTEAPISFPFKSLTDVMLRIYLVFQRVPRICVLHIPQNTTGSGCSSVLSESSWLLQPPQCAKALCMLWSHAVTLSASDSMISRTFSPICVSTASQGQERSFCYFEEIHLT